jgi:N-acetylneuraminic acid mutarotase
VDRDGLGGDDGRWLNDGGRYAPTTDTWTPISTAGAPDHRESATVVWTGSEMIVWEGNVARMGPPVVVATGAAYSPVTNTWRPVTTAGAPRARSGHSAVWTGAEMIVWGGTPTGFANDTLLYTGGRYRP